MPAKTLALLFLTLFCLENNAFTQEGPVKAPTSLFFEFADRRPGQEHSFTWYGEPAPYRMQFPSEQAKGLPHNYLRCGDTLYCFLNGSGELHRAVYSPSGDSLSFVRADHTSFSRYNINSYPFMDRGKIYNIGGYGFWRWNGQLRVFNPGTGDWEIRPLNKEIPLSTISPESFVWHDGARHSLWVLEPIDGNQAIRKDLGSSFTFVDTVHRLDLDKGDWLSMGRLNEAISSSPSSYKLITELDSGLLIDHTGRIEYWNLLSNRIGALNDPQFAQVFHKKIANRSIWYAFRQLYIGDPSNGSLDSLALSGSDFHWTSDRVYELPTLTTHRNSFFLILLVIGVLLTILIMRQKRKNQSDMPKPDLEPDHSLAPSKPESTATFTEVERALLSILFQNSLAGKRTGTEEVNHAIGVSKKSLNNQKKVRSEVIRSINLKYQQLPPNFNPRVIQRVPNDVDARMSDYHLHPDEVGQIRNILQG